MAQWVNSSTAAAPVTVEVQVQSLATQSGLKDLMLPQLWCRSQLWLRFNPWSGNFHMPRVWPWKKGGGHFCLGQMPWENRDIVAGCYCKEPHLTGNHTMFLEEGILWSMELLSVLYQVSAFNPKRERELSWSPIRKSDWNFFKWKSRTAGLGVIK